MEKLSPKERVEGADTVLRGSVRDPKGLSEGKREAFFLDSKKIKIILKKIEKNNTPQKNVKSFQQQKKV